ncbi:hypothetical protein CF641_37660 [Burkholderia pseudomallei]|nr:hypothetical protein CF641_37660 [Burkholderia pseudomallei]
MMRRLRPRRAQLVDYRADQAVVGSAFVDVPGARVHGLTAAFVDTPLKEARTARSRCGSSWPAAVSGSSTRQG